MKILKPLLFAATTTVLLTSCGSAVRPINAALLKNTNEKTTKTWLLLALLAIFDEKTTKTLLLLAFL